MMFCAAPVNDHRASTAPTTTSAIPVPWFVVRRVRLSLTSAIASSGTILSRRSVIVPTAFCPAVRLKTPAVMSRADGIARKQ